jgi:hypothetical protein
VEVALDHLVVARSWQVGYDLPFLNEIISNYGILSAWFETMAGSADSRCHYLSREWCAPCTLLPHESSAVCSVPRVHYLCILLRLSFPLPCRPARRIHRSLQLNISEILGEIMIYVHESPKQNSWRCGQCGVVDLFIGYVVQQPAAGVVQVPTKNASHR